MQILLSNDDSVHAPGIRAMYEELKKLGTVTVVAPLEEKSTAGHSLTIHKPLRVIPVEKNWFGVSGSPADCVYLATREVMKKKPDLVVSGINRGANLGQDVYYSGTVSAAREASILGIPSMAVSLSIDFQKAIKEEKLHYSSAAKVAVKLLKEFNFKDLPKHTLLNLNVPDSPMKRIKGVRLARQGFRHYGGDILKRKDHRGKDYFWVGGQYQGFQPEEDTDCSALEDGYASLTPIKLDCTDFGFMQRLSQSWSFNLKSKK